ncbi:MAG: c-type cytochrome [Bryobacterales bacterium]|nr:c-type cytochrome [Bryobacterales bacterium]
MTLPLPGQHGSTTKNPFDKPSDVFEGGRMFRAQCGACHGPGGAGGAAGPDLTTGTMKRGNSDESLFQIVSKGIPGTPMPGYGASAKEIWQVVAYLRTLSIGKAAEQAKGNVERGAALYTQHKCGGCHELRGAGGWLGPSLDNVGAERSIGHLYAALREPNSDVAPQSWRLRGKTKAGAAVMGVRINEDTFSYQYRDARGLHSVAKSALSEAALVTESAMPSYAGKMTEAEMDDLVAFLANCRVGGGR